MSDGRRRGMLRPLPSACTLGSGYKLPNYNVHEDSTWLFAARVEEMPFTDVKIMYCRFGKTAGVSVVRKTHRMCVLMTHAVGTEMARGPNLKLLLYCSVFAGEVKQASVKVSGLVLAHASFALPRLADAQHTATQHTAMNRSTQRSAGPFVILC